MIYPILNALHSTAPNRIYCFVGVQKYIQYISTNGQTTANTYYGLLAYFCIQLELELMIASATAITQNFDCCANALSKDLFYKTNTLFSEFIEFSLY